MRSAYAVRRPVVNAYLVRQRDRRRLRELGWVVLAVLPIGLALLGYTWLQLEQLRTGYRVEQLERQLHQLAGHERQLRLEAAYLASPVRLAERATSELGMVEPTLDRLLFFEELR